MVLSSLIFSLWECVCMCVHVHLRLYMYVQVHAFMCTTGGQRTLDILLCNSVLQPWDRALMNQWTGAGLAASEPQPYSRLIRVTGTVIPGFLCGCWGFEFRSSCLHSKHSYQMSHLSRAPKYISSSDLVMNWQSLLKVNVSHSHDKIEETGSKKQKFIVFSKGNVD